MSRTVALAVGGTTILGSIIAAVVIALRSKQTEEAVQKSVEGPPGTQSEVKVRLTHYYPWAAVTEAEKKMEGGTTDRKKRPLRTVEDFLSGKSDYVSLAGDYTLWPDGQLIMFPWGDKTLKGRVVDTGGHFHGSKKVIRASGYEPIDVCVFDKNNKPPKSLVTARVVVGDHFDKSKVKEVAFSKFGKSPTSVGGFEDHLPISMHMGLLAEDDLGCGFDSLGAV